MCTALTFSTKDHYFGRTLDLPFSYDEQLLVTPRHFPLHFRCQERMDSHYALIGAGIERENFPLYYEAVNEIGLAAAGLNFPGNAVFFPPQEEKLCIGVFEFIPYLLGRCATLQDAKALLAQIQLCDFPFSRELPAAPLHWLIADQKEAVTVECTKGGMKIFDNPVGVLTNNPPFDIQLFQLNSYLHLSPRTPENHFAPALSLQPYSLGMGTLGLPGDFSSCSRFVRAVFTKMHARCQTDENSSVSQFFHILDTVSQPDGCNQTDEKHFEITQYACCFNMDQGIYYYTTYDNRQITAVHMRHENLEKDRLIAYPMLHKQKIRMQN